MSGDGLYFGEPGATKYAGHTRRPGFVPQHLRYKFPPDPAADIGHRYPRNQRGRGRCFPDHNPIGIATNRVGNLRISDPKTNEASADAATNAIDFSAYDDIPVETSGSDVPPPANSFAEIDLGEVLNRNIQRCRYLKPTPVQRYAIPISLSGRDLMACAQTGSGKTAAFCFPIISSIASSLSVHHTENGHNRGSFVASPLALILSPTRELSCQIHEEANKFCYQTGVRVAVVYGGAPAATQVSHPHPILRDLGKGVDILVATPGRLIDLIERSRISLGRIKHLALDEADRMLDMGFEPQIRKIVEQMNMPPPGIRQTMLFSATFPHAIQVILSYYALIP
ncbi:DEAD-box ATP-dependent RNA helicase 37 [Platanthera guangdongensis]|uniref:DEAD-box ATP-dependent RNA helicase 37 n=1 Tax=Platanthera guangdongensis TaxID=2320717 RepID=A0ABR2LFJ6_9ASPA